jgi:penicillin-binding protein 1C
VHQAIRFEPASEPPRQEWFQPGSELSVVRRVSAPTLARIAYPANGSLIALDPDIPPRRQALPLRIDGQPGAGWRWRLDQTLLGPVQNQGRWLPRPGRHQLQLETRQGELIDRVDFEVRALRGRKG